jgi:hypothetical protein
MMFQGAVDEEVEMTWLDEHASMLVSDISAYGHDIENERNSFVNAVHQANPSAKIVLLAVQRAIHEMLWTSAVLNCGEEHQTASLMGHLAAHFSWYGRGALENEEIEAGQLPTLQWAVQSKAKEAKTGSDFFLIFDPYSKYNEPSEYVRIALFQAKKTFYLKNGDEKYLINHATGKSSAGVSAGEAMRKLIDFAQKDHSNILNNEEFAEIHGILAQTPEKRRYQLESVLRTNFVGRKKTLESKQWCFYSLWRGLHGSLVAAPVAVSLGNVASQVKVDADDKLSRSIRLHNGIIDFSKLVAGCATNPTYDYGIKVKLSDIEEFVHDACQLIRNLSAMVVSSSGGNGPQIESILKQKFTFSRLITPSPSTKPSYSGPAPGRG